MTGQLFHIKLLLQRLSIVLLIYTICRVLFFFFNTPLFPSVSTVGFLKIMAYGLRFDLSAIIYSNLLFIALLAIPFPQRQQLWYQRMLKIIFYIPNSAALFLTVVDFEYFKYTLKRSSGDITGFYFDFMNLFPQFLKDFWYLLLIFISLLVLMEILYRKTSDKNPQIGTAGYPMQLLLLLITGGITAVGARGGFQMRPISPITTLQYVDATLAPLVTNTPFQFYFSLDKKRLHPKKYFPQEQLNQVFTLCKKTQPLKDAVIPFPPSGSKDNIIIIVLESLSQEFMGLYGAEKSYSPFLDSLGRAGIYYKNMFANGTRSVEGIPAVCASLPSLMDEGFIFSPYQTNKLDGIGSLLKRIGYSATFFHGGNNGTFNFDSFSKLAGFDNYYGRNEYGNDGDYDGNWGIFDEPFFQFTASKVNEMKTPFCALLFSLSSHHPYRIPEKYVQAYSQIEDPFLKSMLYTDHALQQFFKTASAMPWFDNTLFIITADHKGPSTDNYYHTWTGRYAIPLVVWKPDSELHGKFDFPVQQADIVPGILDYLDFPYPFCSFGESIFLDSPNRYVYQFMSGTSQIIDGKYVLHFDGNQTTAMYEYKKYQLLEPDIKGTLPEEQQRLENKLKAVLQTYNTAMVENGLANK